ncbi:MAG: methyl-accepting chemotaxis protein, partial [Pseudomonadota bacterium]|nr:methyl-accepting chemotaxis protein [Pseudomonadota bacterium]
MKLKNSIVVKVVVLAMVGLSLVGIGTAVTYQFGLNKFVVEQGQELKDFGLEQEKEKLQNQVHLCLDIIQTYYDRSRDVEQLKKLKSRELQKVVDAVCSQVEAFYQKNHDRLSPEDLDEGLKELVRTARYDHGNYIWINDLVPRMVMHPIKPQLDGKDLSSFKDPQGTYLFNDMVKVCKQRGAGMVSYMWSKPGESEPKEKISYVRLFKPLGWILGSGAWLEDIAAEMQSQALKQVAAMRMKDGNYFWINDLVPRMVMHPIKPQLDDKDLSGFKDAKGKLLFNDFVDVCRSQGEGFVDYWWSKPGQQEPSPKLSFVKLFKPWGWVVGMGCYVDQLDAVVREQSSELKSSLNRIRNQAFIVSLTIGAIIVALLIWLIRILVGRPLAQTIAMVREVAEGDGDLTKRLDADRRDELGELAAGINIFIENLQKMLLRMVRGFESLSGEAESLESLAGQQADGADQMAGKANGVATAAEEMNSNMNTVAAAMEQASTNVSTVASGAEEMSATIAEIAKNAETAKEITDQAVVQGKSASERINELGKAADEIGQVTETINAISSQTNLLALNATIEAARAGEAGKGFAVVANEIKDLAQQTATATGEIAAKIKGIQDSTGSTVTEINEIARINREVDDIVSTIATAVEEQASTTTEIAENITQASSGLGEVNENIAQTSEVSGSIAQEIAEVNEAAGSMSNASAQVRQSAEELKQLSVELDGLMSRFKL